MLLQELIKVREDGSKFVSARDLHKWLGSKKTFDRWNSQNLLSASYDFIKFIEFLPNTTQTRMVVESDFEVTFREVKEVKIKLANNKGSIKENQLFTDYELSLRIASHLAMISKCKKGHEARDYFFECEQLYYKQMETNLKLGSMLLTHREKLQLTKELFYPILEKLGVLDFKKNLVHQKIIKSLFGKYENLNKLTKLTDEDVENYKRLAISMQNDTRYFEDKNQITVWDIIKHL